MRTTVLGEGTRKQESQAQEVEEEDAERPETFLIRDSDFGSIWSS
jgi:hypothetical protein